MKRAEPDRTRTRTLIVGFACLLWLTLLILRLVQLQVLEHSRYKHVVEQQNQNIVDVPPRRGTIYDRSGNILAKNIPAHHIAYQPSDRGSETRQVFRSKLTRLKDLLPRPYRPTSQDEIRVWNRVSKGLPYSYIVRQVPQDLTDKVASARIPGIVLEQTQKREYPQDLLVGRLVGWVNLDGRGQSGVELSYDGILGGRPGQRLDMRDALRRKFQTVTLKQPIPGKDIYLTVDEAIQYFAWSRLQLAVRETGAKAGLVIVSHPPSGEILAMAEVPGYNPNLGLSQNRARGQNDRLLAIRSNLEHGSTMKIATFAAALELGCADWERLYDCREGRRQFGAYTIWDYKKLGRLRFPEVFIHSSNVGTTMIAEKLALGEMHDMLAKLGFGRPTGIDLPAEERGIFKPLVDWEKEKYKFAWVSIGYGFNSTPLQVLQMANIVANRGIVVPFRVVDKIPDSPGSLPETSAPFKRVLSLATTDKLTELMEEVVRQGTGTQAALPGFRVAGKTGTAQKLVDGRYSHDHHTASFVGFVPAENPLLSMIVVLDDPQGRFHGGEVAAPVFGDVAARILRYLRVSGYRLPRAVRITADSRRHTP